MILCRNVDTGLRWFESVDRVLEGVTEKYLGNPLLRFFLGLMSGQLFLEQVHFCRRLGLLFDDEIFHRESLLFEDGPQFGQIALKYFLNLAALHHHLGSDGPFLDGELDCHFAQFSGLQLDMQSGLLVSHLQLEMAGYLLVDEVVVQRLRKSRRLYRSIWLLNHPWLTNGSLARQGHGDGFTELGWSCCLGRTGRQWRTALVLAASLRLEIRLILAVHRSHLLHVLSELLAQRNFDPVR